MGVDVSSIQILLNEVLEVGANAVVLADATGLVIASIIAKGYESALADTLAAISGLLLPTGEQVASYISGGDFQDIVIHTSSQSGNNSVLAYSLDSTPNTPKTGIIIICTLALESQVVHEFQKIKTKFINALEGIAVELPSLNPQSDVSRKVVSFWGALVNRIENAQSVEEIRRALLDAKENYIQIHGSYSTILYAMNTASTVISSNLHEDFSTTKQRIIQQVKDWKKRVIGSPEEGTDNAKD